MIEFYSRYESAIDKHRHVNKEANQDSESTPQVETLAKIEKDAAQIYTRKLFYFVQEEIKSSTSHNTIDELITIDDVKHFKISYLYRQDKVFKVCTTILQF